MDAKTEIKVIQGKDGMWYLMVGEQAYMKSDERRSLWEIAWEAAASLPRCSRRATDVVRP